MTLAVRLVDGIDNVTLQGLCQETASLLDGEEQLPAFLGDSVGEVLDGIGSARYIDELVEVGLSTAHD